MPDVARLELGELLDGLAGAGQHAEDVESDLQSFSQPGIFTQHASPLVYVQSCSEACTGRR